MRALLPFALLLMLTACATEAPRPDDVVKDAAAAIRIGQEVCLGEHVRKGAVISGHWYAKRLGGVWRVWSPGPSAEYHPTFETHVSAADGKDDGCEEYVVTD